MYDELIQKIKELIPQARSNQQYYTSSVLVEAADAIEELSKCMDESIPKSDVEIIIEELSKPRWIPVTERLPEDWEWVLVWGHEGKIPTMMFRESGAWIDDQFDSHTTVTHWMPLPEPPKEG